MIIISDSRIRKKVSKGPKYRFPSYIDFSRCREEIASAFNEFGNRMCKREGVECDALKEWILSIFNIVDRRIKLYSQKTNLLPPTPKTSFRLLRQGIQELHRKYVWFQLTRPQTMSLLFVGYNIKTLKQELNDTKAYEEISTAEKSVVNSHSHELPYNFAVKVKERQDKVPAMYLLK